MENKIKFYDKGTIHLNYSKNSHFFNNNVRNNKKCETGELHIIGQKAEVGLITLERNLNNAEYTVSHE